MKREFGLERIERDVNSVISVGSFDGVHLGHRRILDYLIQRSHARGASSVVVSFDPHPREVLSGQTVPLLTTIEERAKLLDAVGLDRFIVLPFTMEFSELSAETFVRRILVDKIGMTEIIVGHDHGFGRGRRGNTDLLRSLGRLLGFNVDVVSAHVLDSGIVSSSTVRRRLHSGDVLGASRLLGRLYSVTAKVMPGDGRGRKIGYPTANLNVSPNRKVLPRQGVYAVQIEVDGGQYGGMMNIGVRPTFEDASEVRAEVHLFDCDIDLYGRTIDVSFVSRIRDEIKFAGRSDLAAQLKDDESACRKALELHYGTGVDSNSKP